MIKLTLSLFNWLPEGNWGLTPHVPKKKEINRGGEFYVFSWEGNFNEIYRAVGRGDTERDLALARAVTDAGRV